MSGSFTIPNTGETSVNVFYRVILTVTDSGGLTHTSFVDVLPRVSMVTLNGVPGGLTITVDGAEYLENNQTVSAQRRSKRVSGVSRSTGSCR